jgi:beta-N-acetylhexosaminidase
MHYGPLMIDLEGIELNEKERELLQHANVGGVILFTRNYKDVDTLKALVNDIRMTAKKPLLIAVDHEGGRVWRFKEGFSKLPAAKHYSELYAQNPENGLQAAQDAGWIMAAELLDCGIDLSLAPVLDLDRGISAVIGDRAFGADPQVVSRLAGAFIEGMKLVGMAATGKHFPGHGGCAPDSHVAEAIDSRSFDAILAEDLIPFIDLHDKLGALMPAHVIYPAVDSVPAGFSRIWLQDILRKRFQFEGAIISDCLSMKGAAIGGDFVVRARMALDAGCDMVILCQQTRDVVQWVLDNLNRTTSALSNERLSRLAGHFSNAARKAPRPTVAEFG